MNLEGPSLEETLKTPWRRQAWLRGDGCPGTYSVSCVVITQAGAAQMQRTACRPCCGTQKEDKLVDKITTLKPSNFILSFLKDLAHLRAEVSSEVWKKLGK